MFLKRIEMQGFKSFADKTVIQFDHDITGIVGPNGCGKSNINDAIRWVLGEQSTKSLRSGSSMSDIIFAGSQERKPVNLAKVTLVFDNTAHVFDSPFEEIEITRQLSRANNEAGYFINKTPCRLKDISDLVMDTGLGKDSLNIITQGNISSFADAKPEERRLLFEEAAGVAKYKKRKQISLHKLDRTKENLDRVQDIIDEIERQLKPLARQAKKANQYFEYHEELSRIEISVLVDEITTLHARLQDLERELFEKRAKYTSQETTLQKLDEQIQGLRSSMYQTDRDVNALQEQYTQKMEESMRLERRKIELDEKRKYAMRQSDRQQRKAEVQKMLAEAQYEYNDRKARFEQARADYETSNQALSAVRTRLSRKEYEVNQAEDIYRDIANRKTVAENMLRQPYQHQAGVRSVTAAKASLHGIEGVVSELLVPDDKTALAIQAALGGSMYQIVTADEADARQAIRFLKRNRGGRATFLPLTVCKGRYPSDGQRLIASETPGYIAWANDCAACDPRYDAVKDRLLGNVLVIDTLEHANEAAKRLNYRVKIVTLDGEIVHAGGSMTGGRGRSQSSPITLRKELETIERQLQEQETKRSALQDELTDLRNENNRMEQENVQLRVELAKIESVYQAKKEKYASLKGEYEQFNESDAKLQDDELVVQMSKMHAEIDGLTAKIQNQRKHRMDQGTQAEELENRVRLIRREMSAASQEIHEGEVKQTKYRTQLENYLTRLNTDYQMTFEYAQSQKQDIEIEAAKDRVALLHEKINALGSVNPDAPKQYEEIKERYDYLTSQKEDLEQAGARIEQAIKEMDHTMVTQFTDMFNKINDQLDGVFKAMFGGGRAHLKMVDPEDVLNTGIDIDVQPPGKTVKNIQTFSGGEKALIAISVLFSILQARTMPLCIFDEVEAALDQANVERFAKYLSHFKGKSQFIVVTHRPGTMEQCDTLYGVTMQQDGVSQLLKVQLKDAVNITEGEQNDGIS
ncbi:MAG: chromosome segregation protein SMC [Catenisphaera adipataccumulans]|jgi:chromosome segregation protein|uniref:chromosome segregation protein SMC n=1 Tax=Catenisphaera adipataccumulans TaxID=700500 RepID=UPI003D8E064C